VGPMRSYQRAAQGGGWGAASIVAEASGRFRVGYNEGALEGCCDRDLLSFRGVLGGGGGQ